jgi:hypothetical protein
MLQVASISQLTVSRLSRQCGILNISQPYRHSRPVTGIALLLLYFIGYMKDPINISHEFHSIRLGSFQIVSSFRVRTKFVSHCATYFDLALLSSRKYF